MSKAKIYVCMMRITFLGLNAALVWDKVIMMCRHVELLK